MAHRVRKTAEIWRVCLIVGWSVYLALSVASAVAGGNHTCRVVAMPGWPEEIQTCRFWQCPDDWSALGPSPTCAAGDATGYPSPGGFYRCRREGWTTLAYGLSGVIIFTALALLHFRRRSNDSNVRSIDWMRIAQMATISCLIGWLAICGLGVDEQSWRPRRSAFIDSQTSSGATNLSLPVPAGRQPHHYWTGSECATIEPTDPIDFPRDATHKYVLHEIRLAAARSVIAVFLWFSALIVSRFASRRKET